jgi:hypothetical protein
MVSFAIFTSLIRSSSWYPESYVFVKPYIASVADLVVHSPAIAETYRVFHAVSSAEILASTDVQHIYHRLRVEAKLLSCGVVSRAAYLHS